ncbi:conserved exported hypothetical protein [Candidatus Sulfotelmatobacter sp. SbA7]|nr:conserved exported hypothetical protein [Candidatus Sulfotelmatobacter sp. SbA7]
MGMRAQKVVLAGLLMLSLCSQAFGLHQYIPAQSSHRKRKVHLRRARWNPVFRPSRDSLLRQNAEIDRLELPRIQNQAELDQLIANNELVPIVAGETLRFDPRLDPDRRYCRPWTRDFLQDLSGAYYNEFHSQIQVNSAVRTVQVQKKLRRHNRNAAPEKGETASSHLAGITVDIQRRGMTREQIAWMQAYMMPLKEQGLIEPEEERRQWVFHVAVSGSYADWREARTVASDRTVNQPADGPQPEAVATNNTEQ